MKKLFAFLCFLVVAQSVKSQCSAYLNFGGTGSYVTVEFVASGALNPQYVIDWGDGTIDTASTPFFEHNYQIVDQYVIYYYYNDLDNPNCYFFSLDSIILTGGSCIMDFTVQTVEYAAALQAFSDNTSVPIYTIDWGDGSPVVTADAAMHVYGAPGIYNVCVQMYDADPTLPCELFQCHEIEIFGEGVACDVDLQVSLNNQTATAIINGNAASDVQYIINWGDGSFDTNPVAQHTYANTGLYEACIYYGSAANSECQTSSCIEVNVDPFASDCVFNFVPTVSDLDVTIDVLAAGAADPEYYFTWGDGSEGDFGLPAQHTYVAAGTYEICGIYTDLSNPIGCQITECTTVEVANGSGPCAVDLSISQLGNEVFVTLSGTGASTPGYFLEWGDGSLPLTSPTGSHTYANPGPYEICATYYDEIIFGCSATECETILITDIEEWDGIAFIEAWPLPLDQQLNIRLRLNEPGEVQFRMFDAAGRVIRRFAPYGLSNGERMLSLEVDELPKGVYFLECLTEKGHRTLRIIK